VSDDTYEQFQEALSESPLWFELDHLAVRLQNVSTVDSDVSDEVDARLSEAREHVVRARTLVEHEIAEAVVTDDSGGASE
jgi:hypothetical protein